MLEDDYQWKFKTKDEKLKRRAEQAKEELKGTNSEMFEYFLNLHDMQKIKAGELKEVSKATIDTISGDFSSLDDLTRAIQRVFLGMVEKLGYRESEAIKESEVLKVRIDSLIEQHATELRDRDEKEKKLVQQLDKISMEHQALEKDAELFEERLKNVTEKLQARDEELKRRLDRIGELDAKVSEMEPLFKENQQLRQDLQQMERELVSAEKEYKHATELLKFQHEKTLAEKIKEIKDFIAADYENKIDQLRDKWEEHFEKREVAARADEREQAEKRLAVSQEQTRQELERVKNAYQSEIEQFKQELENERAKKKEDSQ